ncbi:unnamed protein product [Bursaphelenchus xylophilus]|uniref:(pine wood nematode) hypothetical protein n=1 Tax=Bursaphelenchus xylophilus TaxID=6326 RepID=A0A1I7S351_BURXY|nr:unnamed protein product [Bursaphelenchus xylophilus]CAG9116097.1 unnamed protein product [Bursaphelenchus xylophilus]
MMNVIRAKRKSEFLLLEVDIKKQKIVVIQPKSSHLSKMGYFEDKTHFLSIEETIYLVQIGAAAVLTPTSTYPLSLSQLIALLPLFGSCLQRFSVFSSLYSNGFVVSRLETEGVQYYKIQKEPEGYEPYFMFFASSNVLQSLPQNRIIIPTGSTTVPRFRFLDSNQSFDLKTTFLVQ